MFCNQTKVVLLKEPDSIIENQGNQSRNPENRLNLGVNAHFYGLS
jgi:hypothetical protein